MSARSYLFVGIAIAALAFGGWRSSLTGLGILKERGDGTRVVAAAAFVPAARALAAYHATTGTYVGADLSPTSPVQVAWSDDARYCLEGGTLHLVGPVGVPQAGGCPAG